MSRRPRRRRPRHPGPPSRRNQARRNQARRDQASATSQPTKPDAASPSRASPVPTAESWFTGWIDLGYRWRTDVGGSLDTYRSFVNLGSGPKADSAPISPSLDPQASPLRQDPRSCLWLGWTSRMKRFHRRRRKIEALRFQRRLSRHRVLRFSSLLRRSAALPRHHAQRAILRHAPHDSAASSSICCPATGSSPILPTTAIPAPAPAPPRS